MQLEWFALAVIGFCILDVSAVGAVLMITAAAMRFLFIDDKIVQLSFCVCGGGAAAFGVALDLKHFDEGLEVVAQLCVLAPL